MAVEPAESFLTPELPRTPRSHHPVEALADLCRRDKVRAKMLVCPGDIANRTSEEGLRFGLEALVQIKNALYATELVTTIGNHDVDSHAKYGPDPFAPARAVAATTVGEPFARLG